LTLKGDLARHGEFDLGSTPGVTPYVEPRADPPRAFSHSRIGPVSVTRWQSAQSGVMADAPDDNAQRPGLVFYYDFDVTEPGIAEGNGQHLAPDAIDLVANERVQGLRAPFNGDAKTDPLRGSHFMEDPREGLCEID